MAEIIPFPCAQNEIADALYRLAERAHYGHISGIVIGVKRSDGDIETLANCATFSDRTDIVSAINDARTVALVDVNFDE